MSPTSSSATGAKSPFRRQGEPWPFKSAAMARSQAGLKPLRTFADGRRETSPYKEPVDGGLLEETIRYQTLITGAGQAEIL